MCLYYSISIFCFNTSISALIEFHLFANSEKKWKKKNWNLYETMLSRSSTLLYIKNWKQIETIWSYIPALVDFIVNKKIETRVKPMWNSIGAFVNIIDS